MRPRRVAALLTLVACAALAQDDRAAAIAAFESRADDRAARAQLAAVVQARPGDAELRALLGRAHLRLGDFEQAAAHLRIAAPALPRDVAVRMKLGETLAGLLGQTGLFGKLKLARELKVVLDEAVAIDPGSLRAREALLQFYLEAPALAGGDAEKASAEVEAIRRLDAGRGAAADASVLLHADRQDAAIAAYRRAIEADPDDLKARFSLGLYLQTLERYDEALEVFEAQAARAPQHGKALYQIGKTAVLAKRRLERGEAALGAYLALGPQEDQDPRREAAHWRLGMIRELQKRPAEARAQYELALKLDPQFGEAIAALKALR